MALLQNQPLVPTKHKWAAIGLTVVLGFVITALTLFPISLPQPVGSGPDKAYHLIAFAGLMLPVSVLYPRALLWLIPFALIFGGAIELIQPFVSRGGEWADFVADAVGVGGGVAIGTATRVFWKTNARRS